MTLEGYSPAARKSASVARKIKNRFGHEAYLRYKNFGIIPPGLDSAPPSSATATQADARPDTPPTHAPNPVADDFLRTLHQGDVVRDKDGQHVRIQKVYPTGLRVHDRKTGVRDISWDQARGMGLKPEPEQEGRAPAARRLGELRKEAGALGVELGGSESIRDIERLIGEAMSSGSELAQIDPMLAADGKEFQDFEAEQPWRSPQMYRLFWDNANVVADEKLDGVRLKLHFTADGVRADSRRRDTGTRRFSEKSANFGHLAVLKVPELEGTVLDTEGLIPAETGVLPSGVRFEGSLSVSTAATNASPAVSRQIQNKFGPMQYWAFDILRYKGKDVTKLPFSERRKLLDEVVSTLHEKIPPTSTFIHPTKLVTGNDKLSFYEDIIGKGGEGVILKTLDHKYQEGKRPKSWMKLKRFQEVDAYVSGFVPGKAGNEGLVGALELSVTIDGKQVPIAAVSQLTGDERLSMTAPDGSLKPEYYGRVVTFRGQQLSKNGRFRHAIFVTWREDKSKDQVDGYELRSELARLNPDRFAPPPVPAQEVAF